MEIRKFDGYNIGFRTKIVPNIHVERAFDIAILEKNGKFLSAIESLMNDGKKDLLELSTEFADKDKRQYKRMVLKINGKEQKSIEHSRVITDNLPIVSGYDAIDLIIKYAKYPNKSKKSNVDIVKSLENLMEKISG